jgi:hypothetical protein
MKITIETKKNTKITKAQSKLMYRAKLKEFGSQSIKDFKKGYPNSIFFFVRDNGKIKAFGAFRNLTVELDKRKYKILGICNIFTLQRGLGYGRMLIAAMVNYIKTSGKTGLGFCGYKRTKFYEKAGLFIAKDLMPKMVYKNPKGELEPEYEADGVYYEGKDKFVSKLLKSKNVAFTDLKDW